MNHYRLVLVLMYFCFTFSSYSQHEKWYVGGQLFARVKSENVISFSDYNILQNKAVSKYGIYSVDKAFKMNEDPLNRVYLIKFSGHLLVEELIKDLELTGQFDYVEKVPLYEMSYTPNDLQPAQWNLKKIMAENAWNIKKGSKDIVIAMVDDAIDTAHPDLEPIVWRNSGEIRGNGVDDDGNGYVDDFIGWDVANNDNNPLPDASNMYHGTHCSGIAGAKTNNAKGIASIAFGCRLMAIKTGYIFNGSVYLSNNIYSGVEYAIMNGAKVISMSWGGPGSSLTEQALFDLAYSKGIVCVAAAGNSGASSKMYPAAYKHVIAVGSTTSSDQISSFSNYGSWVDVMAPGSNIYSTLPNGKYGYLNGTSMACPLVSGLCGLMFSKNPYATPDEIEACLKSGCNNINAQNPGYNGLLGAGRINAENSMMCLKSIKADFTSNLVFTCPGDTIQYYDKSLPKPVALKWKFTGGSPATSFASNPKVKYNSSGIYDVELIVFDSTMSDTILKKNYVNIATPKATLSLNRTIYKGNTTTIRIDFTGMAPFQFTVYDGTASQTISNISYSPYFYSVSPSKTTSYSLVGFKDKKCNGTYSGTSKVIVLPTNYDCSSAIKYQSSFGGSSDDLACGIVEDADNNIYISGNTLNYGNGDAFVAKINNIGSLVWYKTFGGGGNDQFENMILTPGNTLLATGFTASYGQGGDDVWIVNMDTSGKVIWSKTVGGSSSERGYDITATIDNGYIVYGQTNSYGAGDFDNYLIKIDKNGNLKWAKTYGNSQYSSTAGLATFNDGSSIFASNYRVGNGEPLIAKIDSIGTLLWSKRFGGAYDDGMYTLAKGDNDDIYIGGLIRSTSTNQEMLIARFNSSGQNKWMKSITGSGNEALYAIERSGSNFILSGYTASYGSGGQDISLIEFDTSGNIIFAKALGGTGDELSRGCVKSSDDGYYVTGYTKSFSNGGFDIFINKLTCKPEMGCNEKTYSPVVNNLSLSVVNENQDTASGGKMASQSILAINRNLALNNQCKSAGGSSPGFKCLKVNSVSKISSTTTGFTGLLDNGDAFGSTIRNFGDFDGDGVEDLIAGSASDDDGGTNYGAVYIILLKADGSIKSKQKISSTAGGFSGNLSSGIYFGSGVSRLKDLDGDGINDAVIGHNYDNTGNTRAGAVWILFLKADGTVKSYQKIANGTGGFPSI